jgi:hypothetical protein
VGFQGRLEVGLGASVTSLPVEGRGEAWGKLASTGTLLECERRGGAETEEVENGRRKEWRREVVVEGGRWRRREDEDETLASAIGNEMMLRLELWIG